jgi:hypothetical protein
VDRHRRVGSFALSFSVGIALVCEATSPLRIAAAGLIVMMKIARAR